MYANDYKGNLVFAETGDVNDTTNIDKRDGWVIDVPGDPANNTRASVEKGLLWKYCHAADTYRCPSSIDSSNFRSYSINFHLNGSPALCYSDFYNTGTPLGSPSPWIVTKLSKVKPDRLVFVEEFDDRGFNQGSFLQRKGINPTNVNHYRWGDIPALFHKKGTIMSFADGHADYKLWADRRTLTAKRDEIQANNNDLRDLKIAMFGDPAAPKSSY